MKENKPLIFITNDDSVHAKGIDALIEIMRPFGDLIVVAPTEPQSCMSNAVTLKQPLRAFKVREEEGLVVYSCNGTPVDCVKVGMGELAPRRPDLLVSGINHGANSSINSVYSGTVAAAAEAIFYNIPSIAFSLCNYSLQADFSATVPFARAIVEQVFKTGIPEDVCLNVNFPNLPLEKIKGMRLVRQNKGAWAETLERRIDPYGFPYYWLNGDYVNHEPEADDTDEGVLAQGYVSIVPLHFDFTAHNALKQMEGDWNNLTVK